MDVLMIYINGKWQRLDTDDTPAITYQMNTLTDLKDRNAAFSQAIKLPLTRHNVRILNCIDAENVTSDTPYRLFPCKYFIDGINIIGTNVVFYVNNITDTINGQIKSRIKDFFDTLQNKQIETMQLGRIPWTYDNIIAGGNPANALPYWYFLTRVETGHPNDRNFTTMVNGALKNLIPQIHFVPYYKLIDLVNQILLDNDYSLETDLTVLPGYTDDYLPVALNPTFSDNGSFVNNYGAANGNFTFPLSPDKSFWPVYTSFANITNTAYGCFRPDSTYSDDKGNVINTVRYEALIGHKARINISLRINAQDTNTYPVWIRVKKLNLSEQSDSAQLSDIDTAAEWETPNTENGISSADGIVNYTADIELDANDILFIYACIDVPHTYDPSANRGATANVTIDTGAIEDNNHVIPGSDIYLNINTGFSTQYDVIKAFIQTYALNCEIDTIKRKFKAYSFKTLYDNQKTAYDWSDKVDASRKARTLTFANTTYARESTIDYKENTSNEVNESGVFYIDNETLDARKSVLALPYEAGLNLRTLFTNSEVYIADIPLYDYTEQKRIIIINELPPVVHNYEYANAPIHLIQPGSTVNDILIQFSPLQAYDAGALNNRTAVHVIAQDLVGTYYQYLTNRILKRYQAIEDNILLTPLDVQQFNYLIPVWIKKYGAYFYVLKINNFKDKQLTKCNLVRM